MLIPLQLAFPIYSDELEWKSINSRMIIDSGKLVYLFLPCSRGFLLDVPISWYPARLMDAALYADMTNPQILRYWAMLIFWAIVFYSAWFARRSAFPATPFLKILGVVCAPLSIAVLPFQLVMNRPEQGLVVAILLGCTTPVLLSGRQVNTLQAWCLAAFYLLLSWIVVATHIKGLFFLPALVAAGFLAIKKWLPSITLSVAATFGALETLNLWSKRTDCPESPFLVEVFRSLSIRPDDLANGIGQLFSRIGSNYVDATRYWKQVSFQQEYESDWLPSATSPPTTLELLSNAALPAVIFLGFAICAVGVAVEFKRAAKTGVLPRTGASIGLLLIIGIFGVVSFQHAKNFYEAGLLFPMLGLAVLLFLPSIMSQQSNSFRSSAGVLIRGLVLCAAMSQFTLIWRFQGSATSWWNNIASHASEQRSLRNVIERCGIANNSTTSRLVLDDFSYTLLWRTREPVFERYLLGWYGTGIDQTKVIRDRKVSGIVGSCKMIPSNYDENVISTNDYCCVNLSK